jgi:type VI secretion system secreted protein VgrG
MSSPEKKFSFTSTALAHDSFDVVSFTGTEGLSRLYRFDITLVSENGEVDIDSVIKSRARLSILREYGDIAFNGILSGFEQLETVHGRTRYRAILTPAFWRQTLTHHNQIFLDKTIPQIIEAAMNDGGLTSSDYEFRLTGQYDPHDYVCQYNESHFNFISRLMEREGLYYYFEQGDENEKLVITDTAFVHSVMDEGIKMHYSQPSGLNEPERGEVIQTMICSQKMLPAKVLLKNYDYHKPALDLTAESVVSADGIGEVYVYGVKFSTPAEGDRLAKVRAESIRCRAKIFKGESQVPYLRPGYVFSLEGHPRKDFNISYLTTDISHHGDQNFMFTAGLDETGSTSEKVPCYRNTFSVINADIQFRPEQTSEAPHISGVLYAHIDAEGTGQYAEIDEQGRYKVVLPFDLNNVKGGKASCWLRKAQPYAGENHGIHFPLHKGTEVLLTFVDGDPDRPIIAAAVSNLLTPSQVTAQNATQSRITTAGGNLLHFEDLAGSEGIHLFSPNGNVSLIMGSKKAFTPHTQTPAASED